MASITKSSRVLKKNGSLHPPLALVVAPPLIQTDGVCSENSVKALTAITLALMQEMLSVDKMALAMIMAKKSALLDGVPVEEFDRVQNILFSTWRSYQSRNPMYGAFGV